VGLFTTFRISASGLTAQRLRMDVIASNLANSETTRTSEGGPYRRQRVEFAPILAQQLGAAALPPEPSLDPLPADPGQGVRVSAIQSDPTAVRSVYDPAHPDANADGYVVVPDIDVVTEMTDMLSASRAYEANVTVMNATKAMALKTLDLGRG
jgi:flagellar basal-body rod protein FlgC